MAILILSCESESVFTPKKTLAFKDRVILEIDSMTKRSSKYVGYCEQLKSIYIFNETNYKLYFYDVESAENWKIIPFEKSGPKRVGKIDGIYVLNQDSIFFLNGFGNYVSLLNSRAEHMAKYEIFENNNAGHFIQTRSPSFKYSRSTKTLHIPIISSQKINSKETKSAMNYSLDSHEKELYKAWPSNFRKYGGKGRISYMAHNYEKSICVFSYTIDESIHVYDFKNSITTMHYAGSNKIKKPEYYKGGTGIHEKALHQRTQSWFGNIHYDKYQQIYLRSASIAKRVPKGVNPLSSNLKTVHGDEVYVITILLSENFEKIGEVPHVMLPNSAFSTPNGLYVTDSQYQKENEDIMVFKRFEIKNIPQ